MNPEQREDQRYALQNYCPISKEEQIMFSLLSRYTKKRKVAPHELKILDIGCGSGKISKELLKKGYQVIGLDFSEEAIKKARAQGIQARKANLDEGIPEADGTFNVVWAGDIVEHVFDPIGLLKESARVLTRGGIMLITIPNDVGIVSRLKMLFGISHQEQMYRTSGFYKHHTFFTPCLIRFMLEKSGLHEKIFYKILILGKKHFLIRFLPSAFYNEMIIQAEKYGT